jgi:hypothetical protein
LKIFAVVIDLKLRLFYFITTENSITNRDISTEKMEDLITALIGNKIAQDRANATCQGSTYAIDIIDRIKQESEDCNDTVAKIWHVDDVFSINPKLNREQARLVLKMAIDNHDANIGINWDVLKEYASQVLHMAAPAIL